EGKGNADIADAPQIGPDAEAAGPRLGNAPRSDGRALLARDHVDADVARMTDQVVGDRAFDELAPPRLARPADDDVAVIVVPRIAQQLPGHGVAGKRDRVA